MSSTIALVVDTGCDIPMEIVNEGHVYYVPAGIEDNGHVTRDHRDHLEMIEKYRSDFFNQKSRKITTVPVSEQAVSECLDKVAQDYDFVIMMSVAKSRSPTIHDAMVNAAARASRQYSGKKFWTIDSRQVFAGQGLAAIFAYLLMQKEVKESQVRQFLSEKNQRIHCINIPYDIALVRERAKAKGEDSISWFAATVASKLGMHAAVEFYNNKSDTILKGGGELDAFHAQVYEHIIGELNKRECQKFINVSYAGDLNEFSKRPEFKSFQKQCSDRGIKVYLSLMSLGGAVLMGKGSLSIAYAEK